MDSPVLENASDKLKEQLSPCFDPSGEKLLFTNPVDYIPVSQSDFGWGGGYRNLQMQFAYLHKIPVFHDHLVSGLRIIFFPFLHFSTQ